MPNLQCSPMTIRGMNRSPTYTARGTLLCTLGLDETIFLFLYVSLDNDDAGQIQQGRTYCVIHGSAIPAYAPTILCDYGSEQLSERLHPPFVSCEVSLVIGRDRLSCGPQTSLVIEA